MSRPQVTVRRVGRRPTAIRNAAHAPVHFELQSGNRSASRFRRRRHVRAGRPHHNQAVAFVVQASRLHISSVGERVRDD